MRTILYQFARAIVVVACLLVATVLNAQSTSKFATGTTFTQFSLDPWGDSAAVARGKVLLEQSTDIVNQHIMGFGALNPEPYPDQYDFSTIARRIGTTDGAGRNAETIVLTACCAPDWMKGGAPGSTDWSRLEEAPFPAHFDDYAELVAELVGRDEFSNVDYVLVWNEMKGFWDLSRNRWNHETYTELYNKVWRAVKAVRPDIKIGGPYVVLNSFGGSSFYRSDIGGDWGGFDFRDIDVVKYWLQNKVGADFIAVDASTFNRDGVNPVNAFKRTRKFADFSRWLRQLDNTNYPGARTLPLWWAEWYAMPDNAGASAAEKNALMATGLIHTLRSGAAAALIWGPQGDVNGDMFPLGLSNDTRIVDGGRPTPFYATQKAIHDHFSSGTPIIDVESGNLSVEMLASPTKALVVNTSSISQRITLDGSSYNLSAFEVRLLGRAARTPSVSVFDQSVNEADGNVAAVVRLSAPSRAAVDVTAHTRAGSAAPGNDFYGTSRRLRFAPNETQKTLDVQLLDDPRVEADEKFQVRLIAPQNATIGDAIAEITIVDDDRDDTGPPKLFVESVDVPENTGDALVTIRLNRAASERVSALAFTQAASATPGRDYYGRTSRLVFAPGDTVAQLKFAILDDSERESTESVRVRIKDAIGASIAVDRATVNIVDDDYAR